MSMGQMDEEGQDGQTTITEVVGRFDRREPFQAAVEELRAVGFQHSDLSVLDTHQSISASAGGSEAWKETLAGLVGEINYLGPIAAAGIIALSSGVVGAAVAGLIAAGLTGAALKEALDDLRATPHNESFARALEGGALMLWVFAKTELRQEAAREILLRHGASDVHTHERLVSVS